MLTASKAKKLIIAMYEKNEIAKKVAKEYDADKTTAHAVLKEYMESMGKDELKFRDNTDDLNAGKMYRCKRIQGKRVVFDIEKIKETFDKETLNEILIRDFAIADMDGLISLLKSYGVKPSEFKKLLIIKERVNETVVNKMYELGEVSLEVFESCSSTVVVSDYLQISEVKE